MINDSNYILYDDVIEIMGTLKKEFPQEITLGSIGSSFESNEIPLITLTLNPNSTSAMLLTGAHHSRELASV